MLRARVRVWDLLEEGVSVGGLSMYVCVCVCRGVSERKRRGDVRFIEEDFW